MKEEKKDQTLKMEKKVQKKIQGMKKDQKKKVKMVDLKEKIMTMIQEKIMAKVKLMNHHIEEIMTKER